MRRHTAILREIAHELSAAPDRSDRPGSATEARSRFEAYLEGLQTTAPRVGLGAATGHFIDDLVKRYSRYTDHLFKCFDDPRIPATTNGLEGFFGNGKRMLRRALGCGSTSNSVVSNLGADALLAYHQLQQPGATSALALAATTATPADFRSVRAKLAAAEEPAIRQRSMVRCLGRHLDRLRTAWLSSAPPPPDA